MSARRRIERLESQITVDDRLERIKAELDAMPPRAPATVAELRELQRDLNIPDRIMRELFGKQWQK